MVVVAGLVVVAEQVHAVHEEDAHLVAQAVAALARLALRGVERDDEVAEQLLVVHRERQNVRRRVDGPPPLIQLSYPLVITERAGTLLAAVEAVRALLGRRDVPRVGQASSS